MATNDPDCRIILDEPNRVYTAGDIVLGHVLLEVGRRQESCIVAVTIYGRTKTRLHAKESAEAHRDRCLLFPESQILRTPENGIPLSRHTLSFSLVFPSETSASQTCYLNAPLAFNLRLKHDLERSTALGRATHTADSPTTTTTPRTVSGKPPPPTPSLLALGPFSKAEDWSKVVLLRLPEKGASPSLKAYRLKRSYQLKIIVVVGAAEKELEVKTGLPVVVKGQWREGRVEEAAESAGRGEVGEAPPSYREATTAW
ncbi:hypothetical protein W97_01852 [Coniosporium apollinis CBS 100218]|uniref:Arrestin-like N-terminal domain-containing protein n=1 Tax=Coniosporium apollinis (strain CBS 100218) TaxID=1168221 RepID=R7YL87_CONA1|nr:uncharacterized protein W97_01852 [Coniosporium apollinis CBS 100218]EON62628.1 hypothetical protein W97_01852 [Coniosporium apollinis CBS 100218]